MSVPVPSVPRLTVKDQNRYTASTGEPPASITDESWRLKIYSVLVALCIVRLWLMPMTSSLWLDETTTYWSAYKGIGAALSRSQFWPGQNAVFSIIEAVAIRLAGHSEFVLRLPSLLAALGTVWLFLRLGTRLLDRETAALSLVVFASSQEMFETTANARPYALGLFFVVASTWALVRWLDTGRKRDLLSYVLLAAAVPYFHYLFATIFIVHAIYAGYRIQPEPRQRFWHGALAAPVILVLVSPLLWNAAHHKHISTGASFTSTPDFQKLFSAEMPAVLGAGIFLGLLLGFALYRTVKAENVVEPGADTFLLLILWFLVPIFLMFVVSRVSGFKVFVSRYYLPAFPPLALLVGWGIRNLSQKIRVVVAGAVVLVAIASFGTHHLWVNPYLEDWRGAAKEIRRANLDQSTPVLVRTGLIETANPTWSPEPDPDSPLLSPLSKYPVFGRIFLVPTGISDPSERYMDNLSRSILGTAPEFVYMTRDIGDPYEAWLRGRFSTQFAVSKLGHPDGVSVLLFRRVEPGKNPRR